MELDQLKKILAIKNITAKTADVYVYGDIVDGEDYAWSSEDIYPKAIQDYLETAKGKDIRLYVNSGGGSVFAGLQIYNMIKRHDGDVTVIIDGLAASIASVIALVGKIEMPRNAMMMIHKPLFGFASGNANDFRKYAETLDRVQESLMTVYNSRLKDPDKAEAFEALLNAETWMTADEVAEWFTDITIVEPLEAVAVVSESIMNQYKKVPDTVTIVEEIKDLPIVAKVQTTPDPLKGEEPMDIKAILNAVQEGKLSKEDLKAAVKELLGEDFRSETDKVVIDALGKDNASPEAVAVLLADAQAGKTYKTDLIDQAVAARVRAQGEKFTQEQADRFKRVLANSNDLEYIKDEVAAYEELAHEALQGGQGRLTPRGQLDDLDNIPTSPDYNPKGDK